MGAKDQYSIGIDFGTSNLKVGIYTGGKAKIQKLSKDISGDQFEPNIITREKRKDGTYFFEIGKAAQKELKNIDADEMTFVYNVKKHLCEENWEVTFHDGYQSTAIDLSSEVFQWILDKIQTMKGKKLPEKVVITVPVTYSEMQAARIRKAAEQANISVDGVISEPIASFFSFEECSDFLEDDEEKNVFIFDFGGGTIDAALIHLEYVQGIHKISVLSSSGIAFGGSDITNLIIEQIIYPALDDETIQKLESVKSQFYLDVDNAKIRMFADEEEEKDGYYTLNGEQIDYFFSEEQISACLEKLPIKNQIIQMLDQMMEDADLDPEDDEISVHFIGGGSSIPYFRTILEEYFQTELDDYDEDEAMGYVAVGAAAYIGIMEEENNILFENRSAFQIVGELDTGGIYLNRNALYENKTNKKPLMTVLGSEKKYMKFYQKFSPKSEKIYLGYLDLNDPKYEQAVLFDLKICYNGKIEAELYGQSNESLGKEWLITEEL